MSPHSTVPLHPQSTVAHGHDELLHTKQPGPISSAHTELLCGCIAGASNIVSSFPFDTIKVRLQSGGGAYRGTAHCFSDTVRHEGVRTLYKGMSFPLVGGMLETGIDYLVYAEMLSFLGTSHSNPHLTAVPVAASVAGVALSFVLGPTELVKCRMQMANSAYKSPLQCVKALLHQEGPLGLTRGLGATLMREVPGSAIYFTSYEGLRRSLPGNQRHVSGQQDNSLTASLRDAGAAILCGGAAGAMMWAAVLPIDVAKTRLQTAMPGSQWDIGVTAHLRLLWKEGGIKSVYSGLTPSLLRAFTANAFQWLTWELMMRQLKSSSSSGPSH